MTARNLSPQQQKRIGKFAEDAAVSLGLTKEAAQRVIAQGTVVQERFKQLLVEFSADKQLLVEFSAEKFPCHIHAPELIPSWGTVIEDVEPTKLDITKLEFIGFLKGNERYIKGDEMRKRAVKLKGNLGLSDAKYLLANQDKIPVELRGKYIVLPGTVLRIAGGIRSVPSLYWNGGRWILGFFLWLNVHFDGVGRLVRSK